VGSSIKPLTPVDVVYRAKARIMRNRAHIEIALKNRQTVLAAKLQSEINTIRTKIFNEYQILIDY